MRILFENNTNFKAIYLNKDETKRTDNLLRLVNNPVQKEQAKLELFDIFDKHLQEESKNKTKSGLYYQEDFLQRLYLTFLESLETIKSLTTDKLLEILNNTKPNKEEIQEAYRFGTVSINKKLDNRDNGTIETTLSDDKILKPISEASPDERFELSEKIQDVTKQLQSKEEDLLAQRASGKTYKEMANESNVTPNLIRLKVKSAIAKLQHNNNSLPEKIELFADQLIKTFDLKLEKEKVINLIINNIEILDCNIKTIESKIQKTSNLLEIDKNTFLDAALKEPTLFYQKPETIFNNVNKSSELLELSRNLFTQIALQNPSLFYRNPESINNNINTVAQLLKIDRKIFIQAALKFPSLFYLKPETIFNNITKSAEMLEIDSKTFIQAALKRPSLFYQKPETLFNNTVKSAEMLEIDRKAFTQAALKQPQLFYQKPETLFNNITESAKMLEVDIKAFTQAALKQPQLFYQKPETLYNNIAESAKMLEIDKKTFIQIALKAPSLFDMKPETIFNKIDTISKLLDVDRKSVIKLAIITPTLFLQKPENIVKKINIIKYYKQIQGNNNDDIVFSTNSDKNLYSIILKYLIKSSDNIKRGLRENGIVDYLKSQNKIYHFTIPHGEIANEFIKYVQEFSNSNFGKQLFNIVIK